MSSKKGGAGRIRYLPRLLFIIPVVVVLWVPSYNRIEPTLGGVPFFYWYQLAWVLLAAAIVFAVYWIETRITRITQKSEGSDTTGAPGDVL